MSAVPTYPRGIRAGRSEARNFVLTHPVVDQTIHRMPPGAVDIAVYLLVFAGVCAATRRRPAYGIAALIAFVPFAFYRDVAGTTITFPKIALLAVLGGLALRRTGVRALGAPSTRMLLLCAGGVLAATALSLAHAAFRGPALRETFKAAEYAVLFSTVVVAARTDYDERIVRFAFSATVIAVSALALAQEVTGAPSGLWFMEHPIPRIAGPLEGPNQLSGYLGIALCAVTAFLARRDAPLERTALALGSTALVLTFSRAGVAAGFASLGLVAALSPRRNVRAIVATAAGGALTGLSILGAWSFAAAHSVAHLLPFYERFSSTGEAADPGSVGTRSQLWHAALALWRAHPVFGVGAGNFELELASAGYAGVRTHANSLYLQSLVEGGLPLFAATIALVVASIARFWRGPFNEPLVVAALAASAGFALHQMFDLLVFFPKIGELWWIVLALGAARCAATERSKAAA